MSLLSKTKKHVILETLQSVRKYLKDNIGVQEELRVRLDIVQWELKQLQEFTGKIPASIRLNTQVVEEEDPAEYIVTESSTINNGGTTSYYDLPFPPSKKYPKPTLNDLIEYKKMEFWRGDCIKALYALEERAEKSDTSSERRELNKVIYYCNRRLSMLEIADEKDVARESIITNRPFTT